MKNMCEVMFIFGPKINLKRLKKFKVTIIKNLNVKQPHL